MADSLDSIKLLNYLQAAGLFDGRLYAEAEFPGAGYKPAQGPAACFRRRGGFDDDTDAVQVSSFLFKVYGASIVDANRAYEQLHGALQNAAGSEGLLAARRETLGQSLQEPVTGWPFVLVAYSVMTRNL